MAIFIFFWKTGQIGFWIIYGGSYMNRSKS